MSFGWQLALGSGGRVDGLGAVAVRSRFEGTAGGGGGGDTSMGTEKGKETAPTFSLQIALSLLRSALLEPNSAELGYRRCRTGRRRVVGMRLSRLVFSASPGFFFFFTVLTAGLEQVTNGFEGEAAAKH